MLERERALAEEKAAKQRQESLQSAAKLAPWAKKTGTNVNNDQSGVTFHHQTSQEDKSLSLAEIQRLEEERERERKIQKEMEEQQMRELRMKQEQEEQMRRQQVIDFLNSESTIFRIKAGKRKNYFSTFVFTKQFSF